MKTQCTAHINVLVPHICVNLFGMICYKNDLLSEAGAKMPM